ncbi:MAG TPA: lysylphosphatidylglycerol synthase transmembrane domain-containing protein [Gemmataceae bacterium]|nr:lysylphosphatidylglycerol synthase transmembrane domain-containing protein [Gemmataceae bacterium]
MKKYWRLLGSLILVGLLVWRIDWRQVASAFAQLHVTYWLLALGLYLLTQGVSAVRWQMLGHVLGLGGRWRDYLSHYFVGMFFNLVLPTSVGGDVVRGWYLSRSPHPHPLSTTERGEKALVTSSRWGEGGGVKKLGRRTAAFLSVLADRVNGFAVLIVVACVAALCCPTPLPGWIAGIVAGMGAACLLGFASLPLLPWLRRRLPAQPRLTALLDGADLCLRDRRVLVWVTFLSLVVQVANVVLAWLVGVGLGLQVPPLYYGVFIPVVSILTLLPISLNGMGLREAGTVLLLAPLNISSASAVTLSLLIFAIYAAASLMGGMVYLFGRSPRFSMEASGHADSVGGNSDQGRMRKPPAAA